jgi:hypothetical protein
VIAEAIGNISHTTVHSVIRGSQTPSWPVLLKVVRYLGGDIEEFRDLWIAARDTDKATQQLSTPAPKPQGDVSVFLSYAHVDDDATYGRIGKFVDGVANTYRSMTGLEVAIFKDKTSIGLGDNWIDRIRLGLAASSVLLVFVSPAYLRSAVCREELAEFLAFSKSRPASRLIIPVLYTSMSRIEDRFHGDELWQQLKELNALEMPRLRVIEAGASEWVETVEEVSDRIDETLTYIGSQQRDPVSLTQEGKIGDEAEQEGTASMGLLERLAKAEEELPEATQDIVRLSDLMVQLRREAENATPKMQAADSFAKRLHVANNLADALTPVADKMAHVAGRIEKGIGSLSDILRFAIDQVRNGEAKEADLISARQFLRTMDGVADTAIASLVSLESLHASIGKGRGYSARLDKPLSTMQEAVLKIAALRGIFNGWKNEIALVEGRGVTK